AVRAVGREVTTAAGLAPGDGVLSETQQAFVDAAGFQCGYCTPGWVVTASAAARSGPDSTLERTFKGNLCRCTGYRSIRDALARHRNLADLSKPDAELSETGAELPLPADVRRADGKSPPKGGNSTPESDKSAPRSDKSGGVGASVAAPAALDVVRGAAPFTLDEPPPDDRPLLHLKVLRSPHAHARILDIDTSHAEELAGVRLVLTHRNVPEVAYSTALHESHLDNPADTRMLDDVVRFEGQRVAVVVADDVATAELAASLIEVTYEPLPTVFTPTQARAKRAPRLHGEKDATTARISDPARNVAAQLHGEVGDVDGALARAAATATGSFRTGRTSHVYLETLAARAWTDSAGRLVVRTSTQVPFLARVQLARILDLPPEQVRVVAGRVGGGFGGKQEMLTEDLVALAVVRLREAGVEASVEWELTREEQLTVMPPRHPFDVTVALGADADGTLTAVKVEVTTDTGAYGNHAVGVMFHGVHESVAIYRCPNKRIDAEAVYTNNLPSGAFRGYGLGQVIFALESALDDLARNLGISPFDIRRRNAIRPGDDIVTDGTPDPDLKVSSYGLPQCLNLVESSLSDTDLPLSDADLPLLGRTSARTDNWAPGSDKSAPGSDKSAPGSDKSAPGSDKSAPGSDKSAPGSDKSAGWAVGTGVAMGMIATVPPRGHFASAEVTANTDGTFLVRIGTAEFGNGTSTVHVQLAAEALGVSPARVRLWQGDTDATAYDTGAFGSAGTTVAGLAVHKAATDLRGQMETDDSRPLTASATHDGTPRALAFNVHGFRVAVSTATGEVRILDSVHAADAGRVINPEQLRGQIEGGVAQAIGAALQEELVVREGHVVTRTLRDYRTPKIGDIPPTRVLTAETHDELGPLGAKSMSEAPFNPVAAALANAITDAVGVRPHELPMSRDRLWRLLRTEEGRS
ncbi:MAG: molybdopterin-dependent oxidoreductase, partial [Nocardioides sp.]|nr:molybdopterin-dependent oxidoreductase [Nocardioides sp.]